MRDPGGSPSPLVAYSGEPGAFAEDAARTYFGEEAATLPVGGFRGVFEAVASGVAAAGVVPIENLVNGTVRENYDLLLEFPLAIRGEVVVPVRLCLAALPGETLDGIERVYSHVQALGQADAFLRTRPWTLLTTYNTAGAGKSIADRGERGAAAVLSPRAAGLFGLEVLVDGIESDPDNRTRFLVVAARDAILPVARPAAVDPSGSTAHDPRHGDPERAGRAPAGAGGLRRQRPQHVEAGEPPGSRPAVGVRLLGGPRCRRDDTRDPRGPRPARGGRHARPRARELSAGRGRVAAGGQRPAGCGRRGGAGWGSGRRGRAATASASNRARHALERRVRYGGPVLRLPIDVHRIPMLLRSRVTALADVTAHAARRMPARRAIAGLAVAAILVAGCGGVALPSGSLPSVALPAAAERLAPAATERVTPSAADTRADGGPDRHHGSDAATHGGRDRDSGADGDARHPRVPHADAGPDSRSHPEADPRADPRADADTDSDADSHAGANRIPGPDTDPDTDPVAHTDPHADPHTDSIADAGSHADADPFANADVESDAVGHPGSLTAAGTGDGRRVDRHPRTAAPRPGDRAARSGGHCAPEAPPAAYPAGAAGHAGGRVLSNPARAGGRGVRDTGSAGIAGLCRRPHPGRPDPGRRRRSSPWHSCRRRAWPRGAGADGLAGAS